MVSKKCKKMIRIMERAYKSLKDKFSVRDSEQWLKYGSTKIKLLSKQLKTATTLGQKNRISATIGILKTIIAKIKSLPKVGTGVSQRSDRVQWEDSLTAFASRIRTGIVINLEHKDIKLFLDDSKNLIIRKLKNIMLKDSSVKVNCILACKFSITKDSDVIEEFKYFNTRNEEMYMTTNFNQWYNELVAKLLVKVEDFQEKGSGWSMVEIINLTVNINKHMPLCGGLSTFVELPRDIQNKKSVVNIQNNDPYCFLWSVTAALHPSSSHATRTTSYPHFDTVLKYEGINFPMPLKDIAKFEKMNNLTINVYGLERDEGKKSRNEVIPVHVSRNKSDRSTIHLLVHETNIEDSNEELAKNIDTVYHFAWIKNLSRLVSSQISRHNGSTWVCDRCLSHFNTESGLKKHGVDCANLNKTRIIMPKDEESILKFKNYKHKIDVPFVIYADLECILNPIKPKDDANTSAYQKHIAHSIAYYFKCSFDDSQSKFKLYRNEDCVAWFVNELKKIAEPLSATLKSIKPMNPMNHNEKMDFLSAKNCHICQKPFASEDNKHRDHCHFSGKYRGAAHEGCNLNFKNSHTVPVVFHNLSGYDSHFLIKALANQFEGSMKLLPVNKENYISFTKSVKGTFIDYRFIDSFRFMPSSIDSLASYLSNDEMLITRMHCNNAQEVDLLTRKGVFPYDYINSRDRLDETELPTKQNFYSQLKGEDISDAEYSHARKLWQVFNVHTLGEYSDLYLKTDVLLLADIFENFRQKCKTTYDLDPLHYYTASGLAFDAALKCTGAKLELLTDIDMLMFIERGIRGGLSQCSNRYAKANNRYMGAEFDPSEPETYLIYYDVNNLYGAAMSQYLPTGSFEWMGEEDSIDPRDIPDDNEIGYIFEVDLEYPRELQELHKDLPLAPEHYVPPGSKQAKLMTTLFPKNRYILHYQNLKQYMSLGLELVKVHRILKFRQHPWLKKYIDMNNDLRKKSTNDFQKNFYKLMNNAVFGKTMENVRKYRDVRLVSKWDGRYGARALIAKPTFHSRTILDEDTVIIELTRSQVKFNKPIYTGFCILDLAKTYIYDFHYNYIKQTFDYRAKLMYTDTDSLLYHIETPDIYEIMKRDIHKFDTSDYSPDNAYGMPLVNKKVLGLMKDENNGQIMQEFVGLRAKMYSFRVQNSTKMRAKGVQRATLKTITFDDYKRCLFDHQIVIKNQNSIRSQNHKVETVHQRKVALSWNDDKRMIYPNMTDTYPWGYTIINVL